MPNRVKQMSPPITVTRWVGSRTAWEKRAKRVRLGRGGGTGLAVEGQASSLITAMAVCPSNRLGNTYPWLISVGLGPAGSEPAKRFGSTSQFECPPADIVARGVFESRLERDFPLRLIVELKRHTCQVEPPGPLDRGITDPVDCLMILLLGLSPLGQQGVGFGDHCRLDGPLRAC